MATPADPAQRQRSPISDLTAPPHASDLNTFPKLLLHHAEARPYRHAMREKDLGIWQTWTWAQMADNIRALACGLAALGLKRGDKLAIIGDNRPRLYWGITAAQCLGAVPVPLYQDAVADEMAYVLDNADVSIALVENQEQIDKLLEIGNRCPNIHTLIYDDPRGLRGYPSDHILSYDTVQQRGRHYDHRRPGFFERAVDASDGSDIAIILYTSGTTGHPKGVVLTHHNIICTASNAARFDHLTDREELLAYLPLAWVGDNIFCAQSYICGFCVNCPENAATVAGDLREIGPTYYFAPPSVYENMLTQVMIRMEDAGYLKRRLFHYFMGHARKVGKAILDGKAVAGKDRLLYALGNWLVYRPLKDVLGLSRIKRAYTAGEAIGPDIFDFYRSLGINVKQLYGQTEATVFLCMQPDGEVYADTVGLPAPQVELQIDDRGEILYRSPGTFQCYYKNPEATAATKLATGWVRTGDAGFFCEHTHHLKIIDRAKDVGKLADGALFAPKYVENKLKFFSYIKEAVLLGNGKAYAGALINIDLEAVGNWAQRRNLAYAGYIDLTGKPEVYDLIADCVNQVNADLAGDRHLIGCQVRRFLILHKELDADDGELTRTRKVRRQFVHERYLPLIDALYSDRTHCHAVTEVTFEDGRKGSLAADITIRNADLAAARPTAA